MTYKSRLPQGAPTSPALSNAIAVPMDSKLDAYAKRKGYVCSRYADDMVFSSRKTLRGQDISECVLRVREVVARHGFRLNLRKTTVLYRHHRQMITGVVVNDRPLPSRAFRYRLRAMVHNCKKNGLMAEAIRYRGMQKPEYRLVPATPAAWMRAQTLDADEATRKVLRKRLSVTKLATRYASYEKLTRYVPRRFRESVSSLSEQDQFAFLDFWMYLSGTLGFYSQFDRHQATELRAELLTCAIHKASEQKPMPDRRGPVLQSPREASVRNLWDEILDAMRDANEMASLKRNVQPFRLGVPPGLSLKRLVADSRPLFNHFVMNAATHLCEMHRGGVDRLPDRFRSGDIVYNRIRILRNYCAHPPKEKDSKREYERVADIFMHYTGDRVPPSEGVALTSLQEALLQDALSWVRDIRDYLATASAGSIPSSEATGESQP